MTRRLRLIAFVLVLLASRTDTLPLRKRRTSSDQPDDSQQGRPLLSPTSPRSSESHGESHSQVAEIEVPQTAAATAPPTVAGESSLLRETPASPQQLRGVWYRPRGDEHVFSVGQSETDITRTIVIAVTQQSSEPQLDGLGATEIADSTYNAASVALALAHAAPLGVGAGIRAAGDLAMHAADERRLGKLDPATLSHKRTVLGAKLSTALGVILLTVLVPPVGLAGGVAVTTHSLAAASAEAAQRSELVAEVGRMRRIVEASLAQHNQAARWQLKRLIAEAERRADDGDGAHDREWDVSGFGPFQGYQAPTERSGLLSAPYGDGSQRRSYGTMDRQSHGAAATHRVVASTRGSKGAVGGLLPVSRLGVALSPEELLGVLQALRALCFSSKQTDRLLILFRTFPGAVPDAELSRLMRTPLTVNMDTVSGEA